MGVLAEALGLAVGSLCKTSHATQTYADSDSTYPKPLNP